MLSQLVQSFPAVGCDKRFMQLKVEMKTCMVVNQANPLLDLYLYSVLLLWKHAINLFK